MTFSEAVDDLNALVKIAPPRRNDRRDVRCQGLNDDEDIDQFDQGGRQRRRDMRA